MEDKNLSEVRNRIEKRIQEHQNNIKSCLDTIKIYPDWTQKIKQMSDLIEISEIRISELKYILENLL